MLTREQQRELLALALLALAVLLLLALIPTSVLGSRGEAWFPSGNAMGTVGGTLQALCFFALGLASLLLPALIAVAGLRSGDWVSSEKTQRVALFLGGLLLLAPPTIDLMAPGRPWSGRLGSSLAGALSGALGWLGAFLLLLSLLVLLFVATLGWNPLRSLGRWAAKVSGFAGRETQRAWSGLRDRMDALGQRIRVRREEQRALESAEESGSFSFVEEDEDVEEIREEGGALDEIRDEEPDPSRDLPDPLEEAGEVLQTLPPLSHLDEPDRRDRADMERQLDRLGQVLVEKLGTFNVDCTIGGRTTGPVVTQFEVVPAPGVKVNRIANLDADLALAMKAKSIRIVAPIPGKGAVGVEIPNPKAEKVLLREILESSEFARSRAELPLALGRDLTGRPYVADLAKMPHALIAGATGSGKSVCLNAFITSLVFRHTPETLRFLLIDPKMVELSAYVDLPHLRHPVVTDPRDAAGILKWAVYEMEQRYQLLSANGVRSVGEFNKRLRQGTPMRRVYPKGAEGDPDRWAWNDGPVPYVVLVVDELADLMMTVQSEIEKPLTLLAQKARAIGINLLVATQRPSVNVITGLIKANFPTRIAFRVASKTDSRTIIDQNGADALLGQGDMLFLPPGTSEPVRIQGAFLSTEETERLVSWYRDQTSVREKAATGAERWPEEEDILDVVRSLEAESGLDEGGLAGDEERDGLFWDAADICVQQNQGSTSLLQRRLRIGYGRAARIVDQLHEAGILGPPDGSKAREVLLTLADVEFLRRGGEE
ncbi:DNA translocase FtsK [Gemmatimonadota bacterium]